MYVYKGYIWLPWVVATFLHEKEILRFLDDENEENDESTASCSTNRSKIDKNVLISVSVQDISSFSVESLADLLFKT